jgi:hypothetical protein
MDAVVSVPQMLSNYRLVRNRLYDPPNKYVKPAAPPVPAAPPKPVVNERLIKARCFSIQCVVDGTLTEIEQCCLLVECYLSMKTPFMRGVVVALRAASSVFCVDEAAMIGNVSSGINRRRQITMCFASMINNHSLLDVGRWFGVDHTTVLYSTRKHYDLVSTALMAYGVPITRSIAKPEV